MKKINFFKYHGAGNDFIIIDNRQNDISLSKQEIEFMCHRRFGIGADGLMLIELDEKYDFKMVYFNSDGCESTMCGNGGRCIILATHDLKIIDRNAHFNAIDGVHDGKIIEGNLIELSMVSVDEIKEYKGYKMLNTGSPHLVVPVENLQNVDVFRIGRKIRHDEFFGEKGINVNFVEKKEDAFSIRTYERGVEDETWACGTGVTAAALSSVPTIPGDYDVTLNAKGGVLSVKFTIDSALKYKDVVLTGPAQFVFAGTIQL